MKYKFESINESLLYEYANAFNNKKVTLADIKNAFEWLEQKYGTNTALEIDSRLFEKNNNDYVEITGEDTHNQRIIKYPSFLFERHGPISDLDILELGLRFIDLYDYKELGFKNDSYPLMVAFVCLRNKYFLGGSSIDYRFGMLSISFNASIQFHSNSLSNILDTNPEFELFRKLGLITIEDVIIAMNGVFKTNTSNDYWHLYIKILDKKAQKTCIDAVKYWLSTLGELSRQELKEITNDSFSDRSINDALQKLLTSGDVEMIGKPNSPLVKYRCTSKTVRFYGSY